MEVIYSDLGMRIFSHKGGKKSIYFDTQMQEEYLAGQRSAG